jgi:hypothetical protein
MNRLNESGTNMGRKERDYANAESLEDYDPSADRSIELTKETVRDATPGSAIPDDPVTDRNGRVPNTPPPTRNRNSSL